MRWVLPLLFLAMTSTGVHGEEYKNFGGGVGRPVVVVSMVQLIANPDQYHNRNVRVDGVLRLEFEGNALYFTKEHFDNRLSRNALWVEFNYEKIGKKGEELKEYTGTYVMVEGVFDKNKHGHLGAYSGHLTVNRVLVRKKL